ncbi:MAG: OsmC family peroxiredoxin, partial [Gillisia sp.]
MIRKATAVWNGTIKEGKGTISTESGVLKNAQYSFKT